MTEDMVHQTEDPYGIAKYTVELNLMVSQYMFGLNYIIFRPHNVYGENQTIELSRPEKVQSFEILK